MISALRRLFGCRIGTAAVEAAIFAPIFLTLTLGVTDLGTGMFVRMTVNAAAQSGAAYAVINANSNSVCWDSASSNPSLTANPNCLTNIKRAMNDATGLSSFCTDTVCTASITTCADGSPTCIIVSANYPFTPILPVTSGKFAQSWTKSMTVTSTATIRIQ